MSACAKICEATGKRKDGGGTNLGAKRAKRGAEVDAEDDDLGEYSFMMGHAPSSSSNEGCFSAYTAALDSGCSFHTIKKSCLPKDIQINSSTPISIQMASVGATLEALGRASNGIVQKTLVVADKKLAENLVSIPKLDRNGEGVHYNF